MTTPDQHVSEPEENTYGDFQDAANRHAAAETLDQIGLRHGTDKASNGHGYLDIYADIIPNDRPIDLLEIGWYEGASMRMWRDYLHPGSTITGVDIEPKPPIDGVRFIHADATSRDLLRHEGFRGPFADLEAVRFDVIVDDGSHLSPDVIRTFELLWPHVAPGGLYIIEDLHVSYHPDWYGHPDPDSPGPGGNTTSMQYLRELADNVHYGHSDAGPATEYVTWPDIASLTFHPGLAILRK